MKSKPSSRSKKVNVILPFFQKTVEMEHGATKKIYQGQIGDHVKVADGVFLNVSIFTHEDAHRIYEFMTLETR